MKELEPQQKLKKFHGRIIMLVVILAICVGLGLHFYRKSKSIPSSQKVLGAQITPPSLPSLNLTDPLHMLNNAKDELIEAGIHEGGKFASEAASAVTSQLINTALKPLIDKINTLPPEQRQQIKDQIK